MHGGAARSTSLGLRPKQPQHHTAENSIQHQTCRLNMGVRIKEVRLGPRPKHPNHSSMHNMDLVFLHTWFLSWNGKEKQKRLSEESNHDVRLRSWTSASPHHHHHIHVAALVPTRRDWIQQQFVRLDFVFFKLHVSKIQKVTDS